MRVKLNKRLHGARGGGGRSGSGGGQRCSGDTDTAEGCQRPVWPPAPLNKQQLKALVPQRAAMGSLQKPTLQQTPQTLIILLLSAFPVFQELCPVSLQRSHCLSIP